MDRSKVIFGNEIADRDYRKACRKKNKFQKKFGDDSSVKYRFTAVPNGVLSDIGVQELRLSDEGGLELDDKAVIVGNIRMGYGHYRISMAIASAAHALGYKPYWLDLNSFESSTATKIISSQNDLYSLGSRISQKSKLFNKFVWEPINYEGFRKLTYNSADQKVSELMVPLIDGLPKNVPYIATHAWPAQAAVHAGFERVVNCIPDNWPMALHLSEGAVHVVQTPGAFIGYKSLRGMDKKRELKPMPDGTIINVGHFIDHELVSNIPADCEKRLDRLKTGAPRRYLLTIGGAGAQQKLFEDIVRHLLPQVKKGDAVLLINAGDHENVLKAIIDHVPELKDCHTPHYNDFNAARDFIASSGETLSGVHIFLDRDIFAAVYTTNLLLRVCDVVITKPGELAFYPVPKIMNKRVGGHERWNAVRTAEVGDGTYECEKTPEVLAMIDHITYGKEIFSSMVESVIKANEKGLYNGAYEAVKLAFNK